MDRFRHLIEPLHDAAQAFARGLCRSRSEGDDLFQEAVLRAFDKLATLRDDRAFRAWFYRVIVSVHRNRCRRAFWRRLLPFGSPEAPAEADYRTSDWSPEQAEAARRVREALASGQRAAAEHEAHTVKGVAANLGLRALSELAAELERAVRTAEGEELALAAFEPALATAVAALAALPGPEGERATPPIAVAPAGAPELGELARLLEAGDGEAVDYLADQEAGLRAAFRNGEFAAIEQAVQGYEFDVALERLRAAAARAGIDLRERS